MEKGFPLEVGDIVQLTEAKQPAFKQCLMIVTEAKTFGAMGYLPVPASPEPGLAYYRANWNEMELVGRAVMVAK